MESVLRSVSDAGAVAEYIPYPIAGHLFTDASRAEEYSAPATALFWEHTLWFPHG